LPIPTSISAQERRLVAAAALSLPVKPVKNRKKFWDNFFAKPAPGLSRDRRLQERLANAILEERRESR
jgi:hypothetical protein